MSRMRNQGLVGGTIRQTKHYVAALLMVLGGTAVSEAALIDRGAGLIYDDVLDVTWMQDANYGLNFVEPYWDGQMNWTAANNLAGSVDYYDSVRNVTWSDWRLPSTVNSRSNRGFDTTGQSSELAFMYYVNLGYAANTSMSAASPSPTSSNYNPFTNLVYRAYWSGTLSDNPSRAWYLHMHFGLQDFDGISNTARVWLVRDGDVGAPGTASVPEPTTMALLGLGLFGLPVIRRRRN